MQDRRAFLANSGKAALGLTALAAGGSALAACGSSSSSSKASPSSSTSAAAKTVAAKLQLSWVFDAEFAGFYIAAKKGYFTKNGLDISMTPGGPNVTVETVVQSKRADFGLDSSDFITTAVNQGAKLVIIGAEYQKNPLAVTSLVKANIHEPKDLIGKKLGVASGQYDQLKSFLKLNKVNPSDVHFVSLGTDPTPVANGSLDAAVVFSTIEPFVLAEKGFKTNTWLLADFGYNVYNDCIFVTEDTLKNKRSEVVGFLRASILGWQDNIADPSYVIPLVVNDYGKALGLKASNEKSQNDSQIALLQSAATKKSGLFAMSDEDIATNMQSLTLAGVKPNKAIFDTSVLEEVYNGANHLTA